MSYGPHPNDFLFVECAYNTLSLHSLNPNNISSTDGFYLETNESDALFLDDIIFKDFTIAEKEELIHQGYYGFVFPHHRAV